MTRQHCDLLDTKKQRRAIWVRLDDNQFKALTEIAVKDKMTMGQMVKKDLLVRLEVKRAMEENAIKVFDRLKNPTPDKTHREPAKNCE